MTSLRFLMKHGHDDPCKNLKNKVNVNIFFNVVYTDTCHTPYYCCQNCGVAHPLRSKSTEE